MIADDVDVALLLKGMVGENVTQHRELFVRHHRWVRAMAKRRFGIAMGDADDVVQKVFIVACSALQAQTVRAERAWLLAITRRVCANERRNSKLRRDVEAQYIPPMSNIEPEVRLMFKETMQVLAKLDVRQRAVIELTCFDGLSVHGAASQLGVPAQLAESRLLRARRTLERHCRLAEPTAHQQGVESHAP